MNEDNKERIDAHKQMYEDLVKWVMNQYETEIRVLLPSAKITVKEWYSQEIKDLIRGASVHLEFNSWFDAETLDYLCTLLGTKEFRVRSYPLCRLRITFKVPVSSYAKMCMHMAGMWVPSYRKNEGEQK